jgi:uncharacterized membrane protein
MNSNEEKMGTIAFISTIDCYREVVLSKIGSGTLYLKLERYETLQNHLEYIPRRQAERNE